MSRVSQQRTFGILEMETVLLHLADAREQKGEVKVVTEAYSVSSAFGHRGMLDLILLHSPGFAPLC